MFIEADADEMDDIGVMKLGHDDGLHQKVHFRLVGRQFGQRLQVFPIQKANIDMMKSSFNFLYRNALPAGL